MRHLLLCPEYPTSIHRGGIGTYGFHLSHLLAKAGETVHVIARSSTGEVTTEEHWSGRLCIHRIPDPVTNEGQILAASSYAPQSFSWEASLAIEKLISQERIDLIEAQEYEAPLFYFQLRRTLGLGPVGHSPPCIIHLHSPTELIARYNEWDRHHFDWRFAERLESFSMAAADSLISPSHHLAQYAATQLKMQSSGVQIIRYPIGEGETLSRDRSIWENGSICYVGRVEKRKGVREWTEAAVDAARKKSGITFEFVGRDDLDRTILDLIPTDLRPQFAFHGAQSHIELPLFLSRARIAVVPSRWENFPNSCIEAMVSGLPVIARPTGGMPELIEDGYNGWLTAKEGKEGLAEALERALSCSPGLLEEMGKNASERIRDVCGNEKILQEHLRFRNHVASKDAKSLEVILDQHFPEFGADHTDSEMWLNRFIREQPVRRGKKAAELIRKMKKKMHLPVRSALSRRIYRYLARKS